MTHLGRLIAVGVVAILAGCGPAGSESVEGDSTSMLPPEQVEELLSRMPEPDEGIVQAFAEACQSSNVNSCINAGYQACTGWSAYYDCGTPTACLAAMPACRVCYPRDVNGEVYCESHSGYREPRNRYRVCLNPAGASCTEYQLLYNVVCDCAVE